MSKQSRLRRAHKKKQAKNVPGATSLASTALTRRMSQDHLDVLQNIEAILVTAWRRNAEIDDADVDAALRAAMKEEIPSEPHPAAMAYELAQVREMRSDVTVRVWQDALRVVRASVHLHSARQPGDRAYLRFVSPFVL